MVNDIIKERMLRRLKDSILEKWGYDDAYEVLRKLYLTDPNGKCLPDEFVGDDVLMDIYNKFYYFMESIGNEFEEDIYIYVIPCYDDVTTTLFILGDRVLCKDNMKPWNFWFESEEELMEAMYNIYVTILYKLDKSWCCYELMEADITAVAEQKGIDLDTTKLEDVIHYVKKAIPWALDNRDEIILEAIRSAGAIVEDETND